MKSSRTLLLVGIAMLLTTAVTRAETIQEAYLKASNAGAEDPFGRSVGIDGDTLVIGAYGEASNGSGTGNNSNRHHRAESKQYFVTWHGCWSKPQPSTNPANR